MKIDQLEETANRSLESISLSFQTCMENRNFILCSSGTPCDFIFKFTLLLCRSAVNLQGDVHFVMQSLTAAHYPTYLRAKNILCVSYETRQSDSLKLPTNMLALSI